MFTTQVVAISLLVFLHVPSQGMKLPPDFKLCEKKDPNVDVCMKEAIQKALWLMKDGIPSLHVLPIDPLAISQIVIEDSPNRPVSINLKVENAKLYGLKNVKITNVKSDLDKMYVFADILVPVLTLDGEYTMNGKFLVLPLRGKGKIFGKLENAIVTMEVKAQPKIQKGVEHWDPKIFQMRITNTTRFTSDFTNLFNGDDTLAKPTLEALNTNWREFWEALRPALEETFSAVFKNVAANVVSRVSSKEMFL